MSGWTVAFPQPGYIIALADELLAGRVNGGRISAVNGRVITLDRDVDAKPGDRLQLNLPSGILTEPDNSGC